MTRTIRIASAADLARLPARIRAQVVAQQRAQRGPRVLDPAWDAESRQVAALSRDELAAELRHAGDRDRRRLRRMRWRWHRAEFMEAVIRPQVEAIAGWAPDNDMLAELYDADSSPWKLRAGIPGEPAPVEQTLLWASRGSAKTTGLRGLVLHAALNALETGILVICNDADVARPWVATVAEWASRLPPEAAEVYADVRVTRTQLLAVIETDGVEVAMHPRGWASGSIRGINHRGVRPSLVVLDDVESIRNQSSERVREMSANRMNGEVMGVFPLNGGGRAWMLATPMDRTCYSAQVVRGEDETLSGWAVSRHPAVRRWPDARALWDECRAIYRDVDGAVLSLQARGERVTPRETRREQRRRALEFYRPRQAEMDAGAEVLDPVRLPIVACYMLLWTIGPLAFGLEYMVDPATKAPDATFDSSAWTRVAIRDGAIVTRSGSHALARLQAVAYYDPSDGGDPGALAIGVPLPDGRCVLTHVSEMPMRMPEQIAAVVATCDAHDVRTLVAEQNMMHAGEQAQLAQAVATVNRKRTGLGRLAIVLVMQATHEDKDQRIRSLDQPLATGRMMIADGVSSILAERADAWRPGGRSTDDVLDAAQRVGERCGVIADPRNEPARVVRGLGF